ncbi:MAG: transcriptional regulator PpsR [Rhodobacteraceae bacterium]|nr:transcriptional regulator PpsR [Paracoccaceae bacterium]
MTTDGRQLINAGKVPLVAPEVLSEIIATASDIALFIGPDMRVVSVLVNPGHRSYGQLSGWEGKLLTSLLTTESAEKFERRFAEMTQKRRAQVQVELNHVDQTRWEFPVRYALHLMETDGSILMLGRDLRPIAEVQQQLVSAQLALERDYEAQREADTRYRVIMEVTRDPIMLVSAASGRIADLSPAAAALMGGSRAELTGASIAQEFDGRRRSELLEALGGLAAPGTTGPIEVQARRSQLRLNVHSTVFRAAGERILLCQLAVMDGARGTSDELAENLSRLFHEGVDGVVFTDAEGVIKAANEAFLNLTDAASMSIVRGRSLADFLVRGAVDLRMLIDNVKRTGTMRVYSTRLTTDFSGQVDVEISASWLNDRPKPVLGLIIRDARRADALRRSVAGSPDSNARDMVSLVGSSTLRDIVAETTDVIEKMCIETALELTRNNRVAAAELLSLSRQSLYVKLRKFGLINKDEE